MNMAHAGGRPLKFPSVEDLQKKIDEYFKTEVEELWTITGLALHLGTFRDVLIDYQHKDEYSNTIKTAKLRIEMAYERDLRRKGGVHNIFALKNFGWKDKQETDNTHTVTNLSDLLKNKEIKQRDDE
jgi:hypothetical protein